MHMRRAPICAICHGGQWYCDAADFDCEMNGTGAPATRTQMQPFCVSRARAQQRSGTAKFASASDGPLVLQPDVVGGEARVEATVDEHLAVRQQWMSTCPAFAMAQRLEGSLHDRQLHAATVAYVQVGKGYIRHGGQVRAERDLSLRESFWGGCQPPFLQPWLTGRS